MATTTHALQTKHFDVSNKFFDTDNLGYSYVELKSEFITIYVCSNKASDDIVFLVENIECVTQK